MLNVKTPPQAMQIIKDNFGRLNLPVESVSLNQALGRTLAQDIISQEFVPAFDRSMVDGFAVMAADTFGCSETIPAMLDNKGEVLMGQGASITITKGQAVYVPTGGQIPRGADAMVMIEYTEDYDDGLIYIQKPSAPGQHISFKGDDIKPGELILKAGKVIKAKDIGALAALGYQEINVRQRPKIGIISTGDELIDITETPKNSQIRDINSSMLAAAIAALAGEPLLLGIIRDKYDLLKSAITANIDDCDMLLISGGSSVGSRDVTYKVLDDLGDKGVLLHGIAIKPGKPTIVGSVKGKPVFGLPGHPVSAYFIFHLFVRPLIYALLGNSYQDHSIYAKMITNLPSNHGREEYVAVALENSSQGLIVRPIISKSGMISVLSQADGYIKIDRDCEGIDKDSRVEVFLFS
ncbi:MAG: gephyrin-like molybdotransferase Glp [Bacillota bacterium]|jgi:molybdopterin molybdotransferase